MHRTVDDDTTRRRRPLAFLQRRPSRWSLLVPVVAVLAGLLFATSSSLAQGTNIRSAATGLPDLIRSQTYRNAQQARTVEQLRAEVEQLTAEQEPNDVALRALVAETAKVARPAGLTDVRGSGLRVELNDAGLRADQIPEPFTVDDIVVHQQDVQAVVNALWQGGAEAMMIQDQRVVTTSAVRCVGNTLILQGRVYSPPYVVRAIGDPDRMRAALDSSEQVRIYQEYVAAVGLGYDVAALP